MITNQIDQYQTPLILNNVLINKSLSEVNDARRAATIIK